MEALWLIYWALLLCSLIFGIYIAIKYNKALGISQALLSIIFPWWAFIFALKRDYLSQGPEFNELYFIFTKIMSGNIEAILLALLFIALITLCIYNIRLLKKH